VKEETKKEEAKKEEKAEEVGSCSSCIFQHSLVSLSY